MQSYFWSVFFCSQSEYRKMRIRNNSVFGHFSLSDMQPQCTSINDENNFWRYATDFINKNKTVRNIYIKLKILIKLFTIVADFNCIFINFMFLLVVLREPQSISRFPTLRESKTNAFELYYLENLSDGVYRCHFFLFYFVSSWLLSLTYTNVFCDIFNIFLNIQIHLSHSSLSVAKKNLIQQPFHQYQSIFTCIFQHSVSMA